jgi:hypothetical protein
VCDVGVFDLGDDFTEKDEVEIAVVRGGAGRGQQRAISDEGDHVVRCQLLVEPRRDPLVKRRAVGAWTRVTSDRWKPAAMRQQISHGDAFGVREARKPPVDRRGKVQLVAPDQRQRRLTEERLGYASDAGRIVGTHPGMPVAVCLTGDDDHGRVLAHLHLDNATGCDIAGQPLVEDLLELRGIGRHERGCRRVGVDRRPGRVRRRARSQQGGRHGHQHHERQTPQESHGQQLPVHEQAPRLLDRRGCPREVSPFRHRDRSTCTRAPIAEPPG